MRALPKVGGVQLGRVGKGQKLHYIVATACRCVAVTRVTMTAT